MEVSEGVQSLGRQGWNGRKCQEFSHWEDKTGMDGSVRRSSVIGKTRLVSGKTRLEWTEVSEGVQSSSKDRSSLDGLIFTIFTAVPCVNVFDV